MDSFREHPSEYDLPEADEVDQPVDVTSVIGTDERRMHVRAYNHWVSLLRGRDFPSIEDLEPDEVEDFATHSVLLDFTCGRDNPAIPYVGSAIRDECGLNDDMRTIADVPSRSLLSRLTDHYLQIIANRAPVGFEAEFENPNRETICYRGILMPFSSDGDVIDFIYGVINWKHVEARVVTEAEQPDQGANSVDNSFGAEDEAVELEDFAIEPLELTDQLQVPAELEIEEEALDDTQALVSDDAEPSTAPPRVPFSWELQDEAADDSEPEIRVDADAALADRLWAARETAEAVKAGEGRTRAALYRALSLAYDFALAAEEFPDDYAELLEESGVKAQARAPMTPIVKLVFGIDYDKARLTEFAAALSYASREAVERGAFQQFIERQAGGLKALVAAERAARRAAFKPDTKTEAACEQLRTAPAISISEAGPDEEFALVLTRRGRDGRHEPVAFVADEALLARAIRKAV